MRIIEIRKPQPPAEDSFLILKTFAGAVVCVVLYILFAVAF